MSYNIGNPQVEGSKIVGVAFKVGTQSMELPSAMQAFISEWGEKQLPPRHWSTCVTLVDTVTHEIPKESLDRENVDFVVANSQGWGWEELDKLMASEILYNTPPQRPELPRDKGMRNKHEVPTPLQRERVGGNLGRVGAKGGNIDDNQGHAQSGEGVGAKGLPLNNKMDKQVEKCQGPSTRAIEPRGRDLSFQKEMEAHTWLAPKGVLTMAPAEIRQRGGGAAAPEDSATQRPSEGAVTAGGSDPARGLETADMWPKSHSQGGVPPPQREKAQSLSKEGYPNTPIPPSIPKVTQSRPNDHGSPNISKVTQGKPNDHESPTNPRMLPKVEIKALDLFSGTGSVANRLRRRGIHVVTLDIDPKHMPDIRCDVLSWDYKQNYSPSYFQIITASPPCTE
jgi:hypothetical protein